MVTNQTKFRPVYGTESQIIGLSEYQEGWVYVASDTGKIFLCSNNSLKQIGGSGGSGGGSGSSSIYWGSADEDANTLKEDPLDTSGTDSMYLYSLNALDESSSLPNIDGLILNADGRLFRVLDNVIDENRFFSVLLVSVSGGGGGGGPVTTADLTLSIDSSTIDRGTTLIENQDYFISVTGTSTIDSRVSLFFEFTGENNYYKPVPVIADSGEPYLLNTSFLPANNNITMKVTVSSDNTTMRRLPSRTVSDIKVVPMTIRKSNSFNGAAINTSSVAIPYYLGGDYTLDETLHVFIDGNEDYSLTQSVRVSSSEKSVVIPAQSHGSHIITLNVSTELNGMTMTSDSINYEVAWATDGENAPIIWVADYDKTVVRYENFVVQYQVYDPATSGNGRDDYFSVYIYKRGALYSEVSRKYTAGSWLTLDLTESYDVGNNDYTIVCGTSSKPINFYVTTEGSRDLGLVQTDSLAMNFSATGRSNDEISVNRPVWTSGSYVAQFNNFNWYNNGWKNDNDGNGSYLSIANGASLAIPFSDFSSNPVQDFIYNDNTHNYTFEARFRIKNVQEYSTLVTIDPYYFYLIDGVRQDESISINEIKRNGYTVAVDDDGNWIMDEKNSKKIVKTEEGVCLRILESDKREPNGLCIGTQEAYFRSPEGTTNVRYKEDEVINFSVVISTSEKLASIYLNGILAGSLNLGNDSQFEIGNLIEINSNYCDIDIYKLRFYKTGLTMPEVIHNYISDMHNITLYDQNQLTKDDDPTLLSYSKLVAYNEKQMTNDNIAELTMPYAVIEIIDNTVGMIDPNKGTHTTSDDRLPWKKGNNRYCKITFVNPALDALYNAGLIDAQTYKTHSPSYECIGADINVQGTSSQGYPRRNFKTKMKSATGKKDAAKTTHDDWGWRYTNTKFIADAEGGKGKAEFKKWLQDNPTYGTNKYTWKIDYMESSGSYNTGFANLIGNNIYNQHPLDYYNIPGIDTSGMRTSVYGFPVLVFHKHSTPADKAKEGTEVEDEIYEYIGRYNLNADKGSNELYGFEIEVEQPYVNEPWDEEVKNDDGSTTIVHHDHPYISQVAECWELTDNQGTWTSFTYPQSAQETHFNTYDNDSYDPVTHELLQDPKLEVIRHFEARYHYYGDQIEVCASDEKPYDIATAIDNGWDYIDTIPKMNSFIVEKWAHLEQLMNWLDSTDTTKANPERDIDPIEYEVNADPKDMTGVTMRYSGSQKFATFTKDTAVYRLQKFKSEFTEHFNLEYCAVYFVMTELLLCYDSRGKNMMLASYGPQKVGGDYIWFPIFYDIDTQLGLNNIGATLWDYDTDATLEQTFSTPSSVLWVNFYAAFEENIKNKYYSLRTDSKLTYENIDGAYLCSPDVFDSYAMRGLRPIIAIGLDEYYKYVAPSKTGYYNTSGELKYDNNSYAYAVNGDRMLSRELLIRNRLNYMDSYWMAGSYTSAEAIQTGVRIRANANNSSTSDTYLDSVSLNNVLPDNAGQRTLAEYPVDYYDATPEFTITPFLNQYVFTFNDKTPSGQSVKYQGTPVTTTVSDSVSDGYKKTPQFPEQIIYIPGADYLSSMGDLSLKYLSQLTIPIGKRLLDLDVGSDAPNYYNNLLGAGTGQFNLNDSAYIVKDGKTILNPDRKALLQRINLTNVTALAEYIDVSGSDKLREFRALGSQITYALFAEGAPLDTIHLPASVTRIDLTEARNLTRILTSKPVVFGQERDTYTGLYIEGVTDLSSSVSSTALGRINIVGGALGYDSYKLLTNAIEIKERENSEGTRLRINLENVEWSPYIAVEPNSPYNSNETYYRLTDHNTFVPYEFISGSEWQNLTLNEKIFTYNNNPDQDIIDSPELLEKFISDYEQGSVSASRRNHYTNLSSTLGYPVLTGSIYISNANGTPIEESDITEKYNAIWDKLKIYAANVNEAYIAKFVQRLDNGKDSQVDIKRYRKDGEVHPEMSSKVPTKQNYYFVGWTLDPGYAIVNSIDVDTLINEEVILTSPEQFNNLTFNNDNDIFTFYAVFSITSYTISFVDPQDTTFEYYSYQAPYGSYLEGPEDYITTDESDLSETERYKLVGWSREIDSTTGNLYNDIKKAKIVNLENIISQNENQTFYGVFVKEDCLTNPTDNKWFDFTPTNYRDQVDTTYNVSNGWTINTRVPLKGKITLPAYHTDPATGNSYPVVRIASNAFSGLSSDSPTEEERELGFEGQINVPGPGYHLTHIYWYGDTTQFREIYDNAFWNAGTWQSEIVDSRINPRMEKANRGRKIKSDIFVYFDMPLNTRVIGNNAFGNCQKLAPIDFGETKLFYIGRGAFQSAFYTPNSVYPLLHFPGTLAYVDTEAFNNIFFSCGVGLSEITTLQFGGEGDPSNLSTAGQDAFSMEANFATRKHITNFYAYVAEGADNIFAFIIPSTSALSGIYGDNMNGVTYSRRDP